MGEPAIPDYKEIARQSRLKVLDMIYKAQTSHIGSNFSVADIFAVLFENINLDVDKVILSAGWKAAMLYYHLWRKGRITQEELDSYCKPGSKFIGLAEPIHPDIPFAGGSMGMGLAAGVALAWSKKQRDESGTVYVIESDGGIQEGSTFEAMMFAGKHKLDNLYLIIDNNGYQAMGKTSEIIGKIDWLSVFFALGWDCHILNDGHNVMALDAFLTEQNSDRPRVLIADTIKGRGVSWMENDNLYHYKQLSDNEYAAAKKEILWAK